MEGIKERFNTLRPRQIGRHFPDNIFKCIFLNENIWISINISLKFVPINNIQALVQIMAWRRPGDKALSEPMMVSLLMHVCFTRPQWANQTINLYCHLFQLLRVEFYGSNMTALHYFHIQTDCVYVNIKKEGQFKKQIMRVLYWYYYHVKVSFKQELHHFSMSVLPSSL